MLTPLNSRRIWLSSSLSWGFCQINSCGATKQVLQHQHDNTHNNTHRNYRYRVRLKVTINFSVNLWHIFQFDYDGFFICMFSTSQRASVQNCQRNSDLISQPQKLLKFQNALCICWFSHYKMIIFKLWWDNLCFSQGCGQIFNICGEQGSSFVGVMVFP